MYGEINIERIMELSGCSYEQVRLIVVEALKELHKVSYISQTSVTQALIESYFKLGSDACYHLGGILEEARFNTDPETPWSETLLRFADDEILTLSEIIDEWNREYKKSTD